MAWRFASVKSTADQNVRELVEVAYEVLLTVLHWIIQLVPIGVFAIVASVVGTQGFGPFKAMGAFIVAVLLALALQATWYLLRIRFFSWVRPLDALRGMRDALVMAFSTASSTATMPVTYDCLTEKVGVREKTASLGALVGANFNNDGTALYEAMAALFVAQMLGHAPLAHAAADDRADVDRRLGRRRRHPRSRPRDDDAGLQRRRVCRSNTSPSCSPSIGSSTAAAPRSTSWAT